MDGHEVRTLALVAAAPSDDKRAEPALLGMTIQLIEFAMRRLQRIAIASVVLTIALPSSHAAQSPAERRVLIRAGRLIDVVSDTAKTDQGILVTGDRLTRLGPYADVAASAGDAERVDLSRYTVLPGLIDAHTHLFLDGTD